MITFPDFSEEQKLWAKGYNLVIGVDEVGRGCFAGPVVAGAVAFPVCHPDQGDSRVEGSHSTGFGLREIPRLSRHGGIARNDNVVIIDDSKRLKPQEREKSAKWIKENCLAFGIGEISVSIINKVGIGRATAIAMRKAIATVISNIKARNPKQIQNSNNQNPKHFEFRYSNFGFTKTFVLSDAFYIPYIKGITKMRQKPIVKGDHKSISIAAASIVAKVYRDALMQKLSEQYIAYGWGRNKGYGNRDHQEAIMKNGITKLHRIAFVETFLAPPGDSLQTLQAVR